LTARTDQPHIDHVNEQSADDERIVRVERQLLARYRSVSPSWNR
jgi:hypothetical protein